jgi:hypothetical protein
LTPAEKQTFRDVQYKIEHGANAKVPTANELKITQKGKEAANTAISKEAGKEVGASADTQNVLNSITKVDTILDSGDHNIGSALSAVVGRGPIAQTIGKQFETKDSANTQYILDTVNKLATEGMKVLGSNPSTKDLEFWTANKPNIGSSPEFMKQWLSSRKADLEARLKYAGSQVNAGGTAGVAPPRTAPTVSNW